MTSEVGQLACVGVPCRALLLTLGAILSLLSLCGTENASLSKAGRSLHELVPGLVLVPSAQPARKLIKALPAGFDWRAYGLLNPELNLTSEEQASHHYRLHGRRERRCFQCASAVIRYPVASGLTNQLYGHVTSLAIAASLAARGISVELVVPPAKQRETFARGHGFFDALAESLLDLRKMARHWQQRGVMLSQARSEGQHHHCRTVLVPQHPLFRPMSDMVTLLGKSLREASCSPGKPASCVQFSFEKTLMIINGSRALPEMAEAARGMFFNSSIVKLARAVSRELLQSDPGGFSGAHLRLENDWTEYGREGRLEPYIVRMKTVPFSSTAILYISSGIFSYYNSTEISALEQQLVSAGVCKGITYKERLLKAEQLAGLHSEQRALVDLLVLSKASPVVGSASSTLSWYVQEQRRLLGMPPDTFFMIDSQDKDAVWQQYNKQGVLRFAP